MPSIGLFTLYTDTSCYTATCVSCLIDNSLLVQNIFYSEPNSNGVLGEKYVG